MSDIKIEPYYQRQAKEFIDMMFGNKMTNPDFTRADLQKLEDYVAFVLQAAAEAAAKSAVIIHELKKG